MERPAFTVGIEEEYLVVDTETRDLIQSPPAKMWEQINDFFHWLHAEGRIEFSRCDEGLVFIWQ